jgi:anaerobic magnesium-protoporphyrin IX monomethyl ester cyclase
MGRRVFVHELWNFLFRDRRVSNGPTLKQFWGPPQDHEEIPLQVIRLDQKPVQSAEPTVATEALPIMSCKPNGRIAGLPVDQLR